MDMELLLLELDYGKKPNLFWLLRHRLYHNARNDGRVGCGEIPGKLVKRKFNPATTQCGVWCVTSYSVVTQTLVVLHTTRITGTDGIVAG